MWAAEIRTLGGRVARAEVEGKINPVNITKTIERRPRNVDE
jgi:hypothetical protein